MAKAQEILNDRSRARRGRQGFTYTAEQLDDLRSVVEPIARSAARDYVASKNLVTEGHLDKRLKDFERAIVSSLQLKIEQQGSELRKEMAQQGDILRKEMAQQGDILRKEMAQQGKILSEQGNTQAQHTATLAQHTTELSVLNKKTDALGEKVEKLSEQVVKQDEKLNQIQLEIAASENRIVNRLLGWITLISVGSALAVNFAGKLLP